jgi:hypothetical protein
MGHGAAPGFHGTLRSVFQLNRFGLRAELRQELAELALPDFNFAHQRIELRPVDDGQLRERVDGRQRERFVLLRQLHEGHRDLALTLLHCQGNAQVTVEQPAGHPVHNHLLNPPDPFELFFQRGLLKFGVRTPVLGVRQKLVRVCSATSDDA